MFDGVEDGHRKAVSATFFGLPARRPLVELQRGVVAHAHQGGHGAARPRPRPPQHRREPRFALSRLRGGPPPPQRPLVEKTPVPAVRPEAHGRRPGHTEQVLPLAPQRTPRRRRPSSSRAVEEGEGPRARRVGAAAAPQVRIWMIWPPGEVPRVHGLSMGTNRGVQAVSLASFPWERAKYGPGGGDDGDREAAAPSAAWAPHSPRWLP